MNLIMPATTLARLVQRAKVVQSQQPKPQATKVPIGAHALFTFGEQPIVITEDFIKESEKWFIRCLNAYGPSLKGIFEDRSWLVLLNGAYNSTDYDPNKRYDIEKGMSDGFWYVVDTTLLCNYLNETKYHSVARCWKHTIAKKIAKALNLDPEKEPR